MMRRLARRACRPPALLLTVLAVLFAGGMAATTEAASLTGAIPDIRPAVDGDIARSSSDGQLGRLAVCLDDDGPDPSGADDDDAYVTAPPSGGRMPQAPERARHGECGVAAGRVDAESRGPPSVRSA